MKQSRSNERGSLHVIIILLLVVALVGALGWVAWQNFIPKNKAAVSSSNQSSKTTDTEPAKEWLAIKEWGVKLPLTNALKGISYKYEESKDTTSVAYKLETVAECGYGSIGYMVRGHEGAVYYHAPDGTDAVFKPGDPKVGEYYYAFFPPQGLCTSETRSQTQSNAVKDLKSAFESMTEV